MKITVMGDIHIGNKEADRIKFRTALRKADRVIIMGDVIEGITKKDVRHSEDTILDYADQIAEAKKDIKPHAKKVLFAITGNHEQSLLSKTGIDSMKLIYKDLKIPYGYTYNLKIDKDNLFFMHGTGFPVTYGGIVTKLINVAKDHEAKVVFMGHTHKLFDMLIQHDPNPYQIVNTGTFLGQCEYAQYMGFPKPVKGYYVYDTNNGKLEKVIV